MRGVFWGWAVFLVAVVSVAHGIHLGWGFLGGSLWGEPLLQYPDKHLVWSPYIHPPLYAEFLIVLWGLADHFDTDPQYYVYLYSAVVVGIVTVVAAAWVRARHGLMAGLFAALLMAASPNSLRPYEEYPAMKAVVLLVALLAVGYVVRGGTRRAAAVVVAGLFAAELHLSAWFVIGPMFASIFFFVPDRRRGIGIASVVIIGLFLVTTWPGLYDVLADGPDRPPGWITPPWSETISVEWTNPWLFAALLPALHPAVRAASPGVGILAAGVLGFTAITLGLQIAGLAIGGGKGVEAHHYFELVDAVLIVAAAACLAGTRDAFSDRRLLVAACALALLVSQFQLFAAGREMLQSASPGGASHIRSPSCPTPPLLSSPAPPPASVSPPPAPCTASACGWPCARGARSASRS